jgi:hypothetical protein
MSVAIDGVWIYDGVYWTLLTLRVTTLYNSLLHAYTLVSTVTSSIAVAQ